MRSVGYTVPKHSGRPVGSRRTVPRSLCERKNMHGRCHMTDTNPIATSLRVTLVISSLTADGAERVLTVMANYWTELGWSVTILTLNSGPPGLPLTDGVTHRALAVAGETSGLPAKIVGNVRRVSVLRRAIKDTSPDVVVSFMTYPNVASILAAAGLGRPVIVCERLDPRYSTTPWVWDSLRRVLYPRATRVVVQTDQARNYFSRSTRLRTRVIPNPVVRHSDMEDGIAPSARAGSRRTAIGMGRLTEQKGFDLLLRAFAEVAPVYPEWTLEIWGEGSQRGLLEKLVDELALGTRVRMPGRTEHPLLAMRRSDLFVLSSRFEGFPNVLCEAMACGLPVISFDCPSGPSTIVRDGIDGVLVPPGDAHSLAAAMCGLMGDDAERRRLSTRAPEILERFNLHDVMQMWSDLVRDVVGP